MTTLPQSGGFGSYTVMLELGHAFCVQHFPSRAAAAAFANQWQGVADVTAGRLKINGAGRFY